MTGTVQGTVAPKPVGESGFGWDAVFIPRGASRTFAEMEPEEKDQYSMRRIAIELFRANHGAL